MISLTDPEPHRALSETNAMGVSDAPARSSPVLATRITEQRQHIADNGDRLSCGLEPMVVHSSGRSRGGMTLSAGREPSSGASVRSFLSEPLAAAGAPQPCGLAIMLAAHARVCQVTRRAYAAEHADGMCCRRHPVPRSDRSAIPPMSS
jgi:hypothetical protein